MSELNKFSLYSIGYQTSGLLVDLTENIHRDLDNLAEYETVKKYINDKFGEFNNPEDITGLKYPKLNKSILCKMDEQSTIIVLCRNEKTKDIDWAYVKIKE